MRWIAAGFCALLLSAVAAQVFAGLHTITFHSDIDDSEQPYALYVPQAYNPGTKYPLVISLHAEGLNEVAGTEQLFGRSNESGRYRRALPGIDYIVASPSARGSMGYQGIAEKDVYDVLSAVKKRFSIDENRVYLTGSAMGGGGALWLGLTRPDVWAAVAALCPAPPAGSEEFAPNAANIPIALFQGALDPLVPVQSTRRWHELLRQFNPKVEYNEFPLVRHTVWDVAYRDGRIFDWFGSFHRDTHPARVQFVTDRYDYASAFWVQIDGLTPGTLASIDAGFSGVNHVTVQAKNILGFTLKLDGHPEYQRSRPFSVSINGSPVRATGTAQLSFHSTAKGWSAGRYLNAPGEKRPGSEGPMVEALGGPQIYIYGTRGYPDGKDPDARRQAATQAATWSTSKYPLQLKFPVIADGESNQQDLNRRNLILFGTPTTNEIVANFGSSLPMRLNPSAPDYGLVFVYPAGSRYILVNSGLPWWTRSEELDPAGWKFVPLQYRLLAGLGDYVFFKGSLGNIIASGRFTSDWKLPAADADKMRRTGAVEIR